MLAASSVLEELGYGKVIKYRDAPREFSWECALSSSLYQSVGISLLPAMSPLKWSVDIQYVLYSTYVAEQFRKLGLDLGHQGYAPLKGLMVLSFLPARQRWDASESVLYPTLKVSDGGEVKFQEELREIYLAYVAPISAMMTSPDVVARFQLSAEAELTMRDRLPCPRYSVVNKYVSTALLFLEGGHIEDARLTVESGLRAMAEVDVHNRWSEEITARLNILKRHLADLYI
ncbi:hypothetical protein C9I28_13735 [Pseudoduganella armeniaca]|uniref:Uncharacterized protein n=2 Tax=Pseudoduganella armeniaca TaxID=2072590 RepID=A0A2R4CAH9_9BURK|nr:hypothetical protein C9I28_13735 [Pseudoduganella armeniaca]